jgi:hypothetical protein
MVCAKENPAGQIVRQGVREVSPNLNELVPDLKIQALLLSVNSVFVVFVNTAKMFFNIIFESAEFDIGSDQCSIGRIVGAAPIQDVILQDFHPSADKPNNDFFVH